MYNRMTSCLFRGNHRINYLVDISAFAFSRLYSLHSYIILKVNYRFYTNIFTFLQDYQVNLVIDENEIFS